VPLEYQGAAAIGAFLNDRATRRGTPLRLVPTRANGQPAFGCYLDAHAFGLLVVTLEGDRVAAMTWFGDARVFTPFGLPVLLP
jgi:RNA polymerase sigma-70 factor (ECF subfamily)